MAVTLNASPAAVAPVGNCLEYELKLDSGGVAPEVKSTGYQVYVDGAAVTEVEQIPYTGQGEVVDVANHVRPYLATTRKNPATIISGVLDDTFAIEYYLKYGEITFDASDCTTVQDITTTGATKVAINSAFQWHEDPDGLAAGDVVILSSRPTTGYYMRGASDWLWIYRKPNATDSVYVYHKQYDNTGTLITSGTLDWVTEGAHILSVGPANMFGLLDASAAYYTIEIFNATPLNNASRVATYTFHLLSRCRPNAYNDELYWVEPLGGYAGLRFDSVTMGGNAASTRYEQRPGCLADTGGIARADVQARKTAQFSTQIPHVQGIEAWLDGLFTSRTVYMKYRLPSGSDTVVRCNITDGAYQTLNNEDDILISVGVEFSIPVNTL